MASRGDKYIIEIEEVIKCNNGCLYRIKGFDSLVMTPVGLDKLEKYNSEKEKAKRDDDIFIEKIRGFDLGLEEGTRKTIRFAERAIEALDMIDIQDFRRAFVKAVEDAWGKKVDYDMLR